MSNQNQTLQKSDPRRFLIIAEELVQSMREHDISFAYEGEITQQITLAFSALAEATLSKEDEMNLVQRRVYYVIIECLQNITKHADELKFKNSYYAPKGIFMISKSESEYAITTGNPIENNKRDSLRLMIDHVNSLNKTELNEMYMKQISEGQISEEGGAGLGFIDIVRKTGRKLDYHFLEIDNNISFFILTSFVSRDKTKSE